MRTMNTPTIPLKQYLDELHVNGDLSDQEIAKSVGLTRTTVWRLRNGKHSTTNDKSDIKIRNLHARTIKRKKKTAGKNELSQ